MFWQVVHQDIKPENILVTAQIPDQPLKIKICDFGAATRVDAGQTHGGTFSYSAPEALLQEPHTCRKPAVDVWSLRMTIPKIINQMKNKCNRGREIHA